MATPGQLANTLARVLGLGLSEPTVAVHSRNLAAAGIRTTGGRGRSAAKMTAADAAALLITAVASPSLRDSVETFKNYSGLFTQVGRLEIRHKNEVLETMTVSPAWDLRFLPVPSITRLGSDHTFIDFLTALIAATVAGELRLARHKDHDVHSTYQDFAGPSIHLKVTLEVPFESAEVSISTDNFEETHVYWMISADKKTIHTLRPTKIPKTDLRAKYTFTDRTIYAVSKLLGGVKI
ncbi:MAG: hypothetical protein NTV56_18790 [Alphaproteobacteria bacterium]|nr:hypothetical protein [Alphaproteobacteria bacterium]